MEASSSPVPLGLEGLRVLVTGAAGEIGRQAVREFLDQGCKVTALDTKPLDFHALSKKGDQLCILKGDSSDEESIASSIAQAAKQGPINILVTNSGSTDASRNHPIWDLPVEDWDNSRRLFLSIKHFLRSAKTAQEALGKELENLAIVVVGETGELGNGQAGLQHGLVRRVQDDIVKLNSKARINSVEPGLVDTRTLEDAASTTSMRNETPKDVATTIVFLASHRAAGHISGQCVKADRSTTGQFIRKESEIIGKEYNNPQPQPSVDTAPTIPRSLTKPKNKIRVTISIDLDAVSGWLGTGQHPDNILADYSTGFFAARVGVPRLLRMLQKLNLADRCTWFIPGHSAESFPDEVKQVVDSGCEIGLHGYAHEGAYQLTPEQERDVLVRCIEVAQGLTGKKPVGYRAPLYQLRESTLDLLEEFGFEYAHKLTHEYRRLPSRPRLPTLLRPLPTPLSPPNFSLPASTWMHPIPAPAPSSRKDRRPLICVPCNWYMEDMTPLQYLPHTQNSHGYTDVRVIENMWKERFLWLRENEDEPVFPVLMHPDTSGMAHVIGMVERLLRWVGDWGDEVVFCQTGEVARWWGDREEMRRIEREMRG
ncbi:polysaccharide deacetylase family protein [Aspergillus steynii IBT 23096]|uniref:Polysaccharide deacetylase family protein n=1 Tax=Aspergillus steynii IBT 23096 TaxID=1392250 RepID=A0A2I2G5S4_9EURO|nr:polysaccharide deacetylase family protein [Aspergillus steynii IBT 23096]PLB48236.1 polysaccharide deacetylase family protein [Aspergillus steynii IBT 23096]